jgi:hypothetical protein
VLTISLHQNDGLLTQQCFLFPRLLSWAIRPEGKTSMKTVSTILLATLTALTLACGYSSPKTTPPVAGVMPTISALSPDSANAGSAGFTLTVNGTNYNSNAVVNWNGTAQSSTTTYVTTNQLTVAVPASAIAASGTITVTVTNPGNPGSGIYNTGATQSETSNSMTFTINN